MMNWITTNWTSLIGIIGGIIIVARIIVKLTPTKTDNKVLNVIVSLLTHLGLHIK